jgi:hypothetical protein
MRSCLSTYTWTATTEYHTITSLVKGVHQRPPPVSAIPEYNDGPDSKWYPFCSHACMLQGKLTLPMPSQVAGLLATRPQITATHGQLLTLNTSITITAHSIPTHYKFKFTERAAVVSFSKHTESIGLLMFCGVSPCIFIVVCPTCWIKLFIVLLLFHKTGVECGEVALPGHQWAFGLCTA